MRLQTMTLSRPSRLRRNPPPSEARKLEQAQNRESIPVNHEHAAPPASVPLPDRPLSRPDRRLLGGKRRGAGDGDGGEGEGKAAGGAGRDLERPGGGKGGRFLGARAG